MKLLVSLLVVSIALSVNLSRVVEDSDMMFHVEHSENAWDLLKSYHGNQFTSAQVEYLKKICFESKIDILWALARMQTEQGVVVNRDPWNYGVRIERCFSYGFGTHGDLFRGYSNQVSNALMRMRELADEWKPGAVAPVQGHGNVQCANLATYSLHRYNWIWGKASNFGVYNEGNALFVRVLREIQDRYRRVVGIK